MNIYLDLTYVPNSTISTLTTTNTFENNTQSYGILRGATSQSVANNTVTELGTYYTGGTNIVSGYITTPGNGRLQTSKAGVYLCTAQIMWAAGAGERSFWFSISGVSATQLGIQTFVGSAALKNSCNISVVLNLAANDYVSCFVWQSSGAGLGQVFAAGEAESFSMSRVL